jgi:hypothetical protein
MNFFDFIYIHIFFFVFVSVFSDICFGACIHSLGKRTKNHHVRIDSFQCIFSFSVLEPLDKYI